MGGALEGLVLILPGPRRWRAGFAARPRAVVVLGDLNDGVQSNTLGIITQQPRFRLSPSSRVGSSSDVGLYSTALLQRLHSFQDVAAYFVNRPV